MVQCMKDEFGARLVNPRITSKKRTLLSRVHFYFAQPFSPKFLS